MRITTPTWLAGLSLGLALALSSCPTWLVVTLLASLVITFSLDARRSWIAAR